MIVDIEPNSSMIATILRYYSQHDRVSSLINSDPNDNIVDYIVELDQLGDAIKYFKHIAAVDEHKRATALYNKGRQQLIKTSDNIIMQQINSVSPDQLLSLCKSMSNIEIDADSIQG